MGTESLEFSPRIKEKKWDISWEKNLLEVWEKESLYKSNIDPDDPREIVVIDTPPPYASGKWHVGGAAHYAQIDMIARYFRLKGYNVIVPFYLDRNGLPVEVQVEKKYGIVAHDVAKTPEGRERFLRLCKEFLDKAEKDIVSVWKRLGCSFDYWKDGTDSETYRKLTQETFIELYKRGLIYEAERPVRWCPRCKTTLAEAEIEYKDVEGYIYYLVYKLKDTEEPLIVATTRPELLAGCAALAYNPKDDRYKGLAGKKAIAPLYEHEVPIIEHPSVDPNFGTGLMMICSYGDEQDVKLFMELGLKPKVLIDENGRMLPEAGPIAGLTVEKAREKIAEILESKGLLVKKEKIRHSVPVCWRCKTPVQIIHRKEFFLKQMEFKELIKKLALEMEFKPPMHRKKLFDWIDSIAMDWPISRDRFYATEIPVWRCTKCGAVLIPEPGKYYRPWKDEPPWERCPVCGAPKKYLKGETKVFDTWFDSSISALYVTGWKRWPKRFYERASRNVLRPQGQDIIRTWLYYSILRVYLLTGRKAFKWVRITGMGLDPKGRPMHKSLGNVIDPDPIVDKYGADAFRFWSAIAAKLGYDYRFDEGKVRTGRNFATKLWNIARFISSFPEPTEGYRLRSVDKAFLALLDEYIIEIDRWYSELDVYEPIQRLYDYAWNYFASNYVELVKNRAYNREGSYSIEEQRGAWKTLYVIFKKLLIALSPIMPFVTDKIFRVMFNDSVHRQRWPDVTIKDPAERKRLAELAMKVANVNSEIWGYKKKMGIRLKDGIEGSVLLIPDDLKDFVKELEDLHKSSFDTYKAVPENAKAIGSIVYLVKRT